MVASASFQAMAANLLVAAASNFTSTSTNMSSSSASTTSFPSLLLSSSSLSSSSSSSSSSATFSDSEYFDQDMEVLAPPALRNFVDKGGGSLAGGVVGSGDGASSSLNQFASANMTIEDFRAFLLEANMSPSYRSARATRHSVIIAFYSAIVLVSLFGNLFVCYVITKRRRMRTRTNFLMANMAVSDLMIASITIPMTIARILLSEWPFGSLLCIVVPLVQVTSVYVSTLTMAVIAADRYQAIINPLHKRLTTSVPIAAIIALIWVASVLFALPNVAFNRVVEMASVVATKPLLHRCQAVYPGDSGATYRRQITLFTFLTQYAVPLSFTAFAYVRISFYVWQKLPEPNADGQFSSASTVSTEKMNGAGGGGQLVGHQLIGNGHPHHPQQQQHEQQYMEGSMASGPASGLVGSSLKRSAPGGTAALCYYSANVSQLRERSRRKTIKMLMIVVIAFGIAWAPLNLYHLYSDFFSSNRVGDQNVFFVCHWFAMSSISFNSFIYFVLNRHYRQELANLTRCAHWKYFRCLGGNGSSSSSGGNGGGGGGEELKLSPPYEDAVMLRNGKRCPPTPWTPLAAAKKAAAAAQSGKNGSKSLQREVIIQQVKQQDANNNNTTCQMVRNGFSKLSGSGGSNHSKSTQQQQHARVRYVSEKPANCKIIFRSKYTNGNLPHGRLMGAATSSSSSSSTSGCCGDNNSREQSSGVSVSGGGGVRGRSAIKATGPNGKPCRLQRSNAVRVSGASNVSAASMASSSGRSADSTHRGSDI